MGKKSKKKKKKKIWNTHSQHTMRHRGLENENIYRGGVDNSVYHNHVNSRPSADFIPPTPQPINRLGVGISVDEIVARSDGSYWGMRETQTTKPVLNEEQEANLKTASDEALFRSKRAKDKSAVQPWSMNREIGGRKGHRRQSHRDLQEDPEYDYGHAMYSPMRQEQHFEESFKKWEREEEERVRKLPLSFRLRDGVVGIDDGLGADPPTFLGRDVGDFELVEEEEGMDTLMRLKHKKTT